MSNIHNEMAKEGIYDTVMEMTVEDFIEAIVTEIKTDALEFEKFIQQKVEMLVEKNFEEMCE